MEGEAPAKPSPKMRRHLRLAMTLREATSAIETSVAEIHSIRLFIFALLLCALAGCRPAPPAADVNAPIRVAVIGGMVMTGLWQEIADNFHHRTGLTIELAATGPKEVLDETFRKGGVDLVTLHSSDVATNLVADGLAERMRPWARNELVLVGPVADPARVYGLTSGVEALKRIAAKGAPFVEARNMGSQMITTHLWRLAGIAPAGPWLLKDESDSRQDVVRFAASKNAYVIVGRIPVLSGKIPAPGMTIMVEGDPEMRRPYVVLEAVPARCRNRNPEGARRLADFLVSHEGQLALQSFAMRQGGSKPIFYSIENSGSATP